MYKIFTGANGYYVAWEGDDGFHGQPQDNGSSIGWDRPKAERELRARVRSKAERDRERIREKEYARQQSQPR